MVANLNLVLEWSMLPWQTFTLDNGATLVLQPLAGTACVTVEVFLGIGSKYEDKTERGLSHFLEHMAFKGSKKRPSATILNQEIDSRGAAHNAGTGHEFTSYYIKTTAEETTWAIELLTDMILEPRLPNEEIKKEQGVIIEEIKMYNDNPTMGLAYDFTDFLYKDNPSGCWNITGSQADIENVTRQKVVNYRQKHLSAQRMVIVIAGELKRGEEKKVVTVVNQALGKFKNDKLEEQDLSIKGLAMTDNKEKIITKAVDQAHFCLGWKGVARNDPRFYATRLWDIIMAGNSSSRLWSRLREEKGWAYYIEPISTQWVETGFMGIQAGVTAERIDDALELAKLELSRAGEDIRQIELERAKKYWWGKIALAMDEADFWTGYLGQRQLLDGEIPAMEKLKERYLSVSLKEMKRVAAELMTQDSWRWMVVKP